MLSLVVHMVVHLHNTHLTTFVAFSLTLNTISFEYSTLEWFAISTCIAIAVDLLPSSMQLRNSYRISRDTRYLVLLFNVNLAQKKAENLLYFPPQLLAFI